MSLTNYRDVGKGSTDSHAGFQYEFYCASCTRTWKSPYQPYRRGQFAGLIYKLAYYLGDKGSMSRATSDLANAGADGARESALREAIGLAEQRYTECPSCKKTVCADCWDERARMCEQCATHGGRSQDAGAGARGAADAGAGSGAKCSNCGASMGGGRFCAECGFDVASTHKACPGCGTLCARAARFCTDCGHGF